MENIQTVWEKIAAKRKQVRMIYVAHIAVYVLAIVLMVIGQQQAMLLLGLANMIVYWLFVRRQNKAYSAAVTDANIRYGLCAPLQQVEYTGKNGGMTDEAFRALQLLPLYKNPSPGNATLMCHNKLTGTYKGLALTCLEATLHYSYKGNKNRPLFNFLNGTLLVAEGLPASEARGDWLLLHRDMIHEDARRAFAEACGYRLLQCSEEMGKLFYVYTHGSEAELPDHLYKQILMLEKTAPCTGAIRLTGDQAVVFLHDRLYSFRTPLHTLPTVENLTTSPVPEMDGALRFIHYWAQVK